MAIEITDATGTVQLGGTITGTYALPVVADDAAAAALLSPGEWLVAENTAESDKPVVFALNSAGDVFFIELTAV